MPKELDISDTPEPNKKLITNLVMRDNMQQHFNIETILVKRSSTEVEMQHLQNMF